jgi:hypothetical protein
MLAGHLERTRALQMHDAAALNVIACHQVVGGSYVETAVSRILKSMSSFMLLFPEVTLSGLVSFLLATRLLVTIVRMKTEISSRHLSEHHSPA